MWVVCTDRQRKSTHNTTLAIGRVSCSADSFVVAETFVPGIKFTVRNPPHRQAAKRYAAL